MQSSCLPKHSKRKLYYCYSSTRIDGLLPGLELCQVIVTRSNINQTPRMSIALLLIGTTLREWHVIWLRYWSNGSSLNLLHMSGLFLSSFASFESLALILAVSSQFNLCVLSLKPGNSTISPSASVSFQRGFPSLKWNPKLSTKPKGLILSSIYECMVWQTISREVLMRAAERCETNGS